MYNENVENTSDSINLDELINGLSSDIKNINNLMADLNNKRKANKELEESIVTEREKLEKDKEQFENYVRLMNSEFEAIKKSQLLSLENEKLALAKAENDFNESVVSTKAELELTKNELDVRTKALNEDKEQFEKYKEIEDRRIRQERDALEKEKQQFDEYKDVNYKRIEIEKKNIERQFNKFKQLVDQFNFNFASETDGNIEE